MLSDTSISQINLSTGDRYYSNSTISKRKWKSVSYIANYFEDKSALWAWKQKVGEEEAARVARNASTDGTAIHSANEAYFTGKHVELNKEQKKVKSNFDLFLNKVISAPAVENKVFWEALLNQQGERSDSGMLVGVGGSFDALVEVNGKDFKAAVGDTSPLFDNDSYVLVDYKTKKANPNPLFLIKYAAQISAYVAGINNTKQYRIDKGMVVIGTENGLYLYYLDREALNFYWKAFRQMLFAYYSNLRFDWESFKKRAQGLVCNEEDKDWDYIGRNFLPQQVYLND